MSLSVLSLPFDPPVRVPLHRLGVFSVYEDFVRANESLVKSMEEGLRTVILFMPGRFNEAEVSAESRISLYVCLYK